MKILLTIGIFLFSILGYSQQIVKESIDSGGGVATATGIKIVHTIGETVVAEKNNGNLHVSEGFIGTEFASYLEVEHFTALIGVNAYPNPTTEILNITFTEPQNYQIQIFDMSGKVVLQKQTNNTRSFALNVSNLQAAPYIVLIKNYFTKQFKTFKLIKE